MDPYTIVISLPAAEPFEAPTRSIAGFWRRLSAFSIDVIVVSVPGFLVGFLLYEFFLNNPTWGSLIGFAITVSYFALLGSSISAGQTLGQHWIGIEVIDANGNHLSVRRSFLRYTVLFVPVFLAGAQTGVPALLASYAGLAIVYLYLFNSRTRQTLHDLVTGSFVVETPGTGAIERSPVWPWHWVILGVLAVLGTIAVSQLYRSGPFPELAAVYNALNDAEDFRVVNVKLEINKIKQTTGLRVIVAFSSKPTNYEQAAARIVALVEEADAQAAQRDFIAVDFEEGFHVGLAKFSTYRHVSHTPQQWEKILPNPAE